MKGLETLTGFDRSEATASSCETPTPARRCGGKLTSMRPVLALCLSTLSIFIIAPLCYGQCPLRLPPKCQPIANQIKSLEAERNDLQAQLKQAAGSQKAGIAGQIKNLLSQIAAKQKQVDSCALASGKLDLSATLQGKVRLGFLRNDPKFNVPDWQYEKPQQVSIQLTYPRWVHDQIVVKGVGQISYELRGLTTNSELANMAGAQFSSDCGDVDPKAGKLSLTLTMPVSLSGRLASEGGKGSPYDLGFSNLAITLSTGNTGGSPFSSTSKITLSGEGVFQDGLLKGLHCRMSVEGTLQPLP